LILGFLAYARREASKAAPKSTAEINAFKQHVEGAIAAMVQVFRDGAYERCRQADARAQEIVDKELEVLKTD
jgi:hypothetical protein